MNIDLDADELELLLTIVALQIWQTRMAGDQSGLLGRRLRETRALYEKLKEAKT